MNLKMETRRHFLERCSLGLAGMYLSAAENPLALRKPHFEPKAQAVIYLHMAGSPSQLELFDYKPELIKYNGKPCPDELQIGRASCRERV